MRHVTHKALLLLLVMVCMASGSRPVSGEPQTVSGLRIDKSSIGGVVLNSNGGKPEAGVWVIAETKSLPVPFRKIVVTDERGRFLAPDLPGGSYELWVRGYGLKDSDHVKASQGAQVRIQVADAASLQEAAKIYPASYWTSMIQPPSKSELPGNYTSQDQWLAAWRNGCNHCHELGMVATRRYTTPEEWDSVFHRANGMNQEVERLGRAALEKSLSDWGVRIKAGEVPPAPPRPTGMERNVVISQWDWGADDSFIHDVTSTDKRNPTLYANGKVYGADRTGGGRLWVLDPVKNTVQGIQVQPRDAKGWSTKVDYYHDAESEDAWMASPHNPTSSSLAIPRKHTP